MTRITDAMLKEWEGLENAATQDWRLRGIAGYPDLLVIEINGRVLGLDRCDAEFIAAARTALPLLIAEVRRLRHGG